jgi:alpha-D-ribose 1-methylphosphonate 5-triphosphate synthase subunit PhnL
MPAMLTASGLSKGFTMHLRGGSRLEVLQNASFALEAGECAVLGGPSGAGKSSILKMLYGNYAVDEGRIEIIHHGRRIDLAKASPREIIRVRRDTLAYVSQFLSVVPRVATIDIVSEPLVERGMQAPEAREIASRLLARLNLPKQLWNLPPATFSGGERQRVNIARGFITDHPILLLDEPTASLDKTNRDVVIEMIREKKRAGAAMLGIFHDEDVRSEVADKVIDVTLFAPKKAAA